MTTTTMIEHVQQALDASEAKRKAKFDAAKNNTERLMALGVIISCDDAQDNAYRWSYMQEQSKLAGVSPALFEDASDFAHLADSIIEQWKSIAENGEMPEEFGARVAEAAAKVVKVAEGMKKPCTHKSTSKAQGLIRSDDRDRDHARFICCRCGSEIRVSIEPPIRTAAAAEATALYTQFNNPGMLALRDAEFERAMAKSNAKRGN